MNYSSIKELINIVNNSKLTTFEMEFDGVKLKMGKGETSSNKSEEVSTNKNFESSNTHKNEEVREELEENNDTPKVITGETIKAPLVGTFYSSAGEGKEVFVKPGDLVKKGDTVCILEAMKIMNEIQSPRDGKIVEILVQNEQMVEYGQPLFVIE